MERTDRLTCLQRKLDSAVISWCRDHESELRELVSTAQAGIPLQVSNGRQQPVGISVLPIVADPVNIDFARRVVSATLVARYALLSAISEDRDLRAFLTWGTSDIAREASLANADLPGFFRGRTDTMISLRGEPACGIVEFNGEPLGEHLIAASQKVVVGVVERMAKLQLPAERTRHPYEPSFEKFLTEYEKLRQRGDGSLPAKPNIGYFVNRDPAARDPYPRLAFAASDRLRYLEAHYGVGGKLFHPTDIEGFSELRLDGKTICLPRVDGMDLHIIRWVHDEPFEFEAFWRTFRADQPEIYYRFTGVTHPVHNPEGGGSLLAINGFSTFPTDKKFDVILGDSELRQRFQLAERIDKVLADQATRDALRPPEDFTRDEVCALLDRGMPRTRMLRVAGSGLYPESGRDDSYGLSEQEIEQLVAERRQWVIKLSSLSCSSKGVFVGRGFGLEGLPEDLLASIPDGPRRQVHEILEGREAEASPQRLTEAEMETLRDLLWPALVRYALDTGESIAQRAIDSRVVDGFFFRSGEPLPEQAEPLKYDYNFMSLGAETLHPLFRVTTAEDVTSIAGGRGGLAISITPADAEEILRAVDAHA